MANLDKPAVIEGGFAIDDRGQLSFVNDFSFEKVNRFYTLENFSLDTVRAWHGHMKEEKNVFVVSGSAIVAAVPLSDEEHPDTNVEFSRFVLSARKPAVLHIPAGYANGIKCLEANTKIFIFSSSKLEDSKGDDYRFPSDYWGDAVWKVENR